MVCACTLSHTATILLPRAPSGGEPDRHLACFEWEKVKEVPGGDDPAKSEAVFDIPLTKKESVYGLVVNQHTQVSMGDWLVVLLDAGG